MKTLEIVCERKKISIPVEKIIYIERAGRQVKVICKRECYMTYDSLKDILSRLTKNFIRCHTGYIVNKDYVIAFKSRYIELVNNINISIGRVYADKVKEELS